MAPDGRATTRTGGRAATNAVIPGDFALSVGNPESPLPEGWKWTRLTDLARLETGHTPSRRHPEYWGGDIPWIGIRDATANHGMRLRSTAQYTNSLGIKNSSARVLPANTVCLSRTASVGYVVVMGRPMATSQDFVNWVCSEKLDYRFLKYVLLAERESFLRFAHGTTHQTIYFPEVKAFYIALPPRSEQQAIAEVLSALDDRIDLLRQTNITLEAIAQALFKSWFVDFDPVHAKAEGRDPEAMDAATAALFPSEFEESELGLIPKGWRVMSLLDTCDLQGGAQPPASMFVDEPKAGYVRLLQIRDFSTDAHPTYIPESKKLRTAQVDDILIGRYGSGSGNKQKDSLGRICRGLEGAYNVALMKLVPGSVGREFAFQVFNDQNFYNYLQGVSAKAVQSGFSKKELALYKIVVPDDRVLERYESMGSTVWEQVKLKRHRIATLAQLRDTLLPRLISGKLRLPEATEAATEECTA